MNNFLAKAKQTVNQGEGTAPKAPTGMPPMPKGVPGAPKRPAGVPPIPKGMPKPPVPGVGKPPVAGVPKKPAVPGVPPTTTKKEEVKAEVKEEVKETKTPLTASKNPFINPEAAKKTATQPKEEKAVDTEKPLEAKNGPENEPANENKKPEEEPKEKKTTKKKASSRSKKKEEDKAEEKKEATDKVVAPSEMKVEPIRIPTSEVTFEEAIAAIKSPFVSKEWEDFRADISARLDDIQITNEMNTSSLKAVLAELNELRSAIWKQFVDSKTYYENLTNKEPEGIIERIKRLNSVGSNAEQRKINGINAVINYKNENGQIVNLYEVLDEIRGRYNFLKGLMDIIQYKNNILVTMLGGMKLEK